MQHSKEDLVLLSEGSRVGLPSRVKIIRSIPTTTGRIAYLVQCETIVSEYATSRLLLLPRVRGQALEPDIGSITGVYIYNADDINANSPTVLDEAQHHTILDWGLVAHGDEADRIIQGRSF